MRSVEEVIDYLKAHELRLSTAESCTAGTLIALLSDVPGSGACLEAGYVVYSPRAKQQVLGVSDDCLARFNLTSEEVARCMALGALQRSVSSVAVATTGVAGPEPMDDIPPGTVCFAWAFETDAGPRLFSDTCHFDGDRSTVREAAARHALGAIPDYHRRRDEGSAQAYPGPAG